MPTFIGSKVCSRVTFAFVVGRSLDHSSSKTCRRVVPALLFVRQSYFSQPAHFLIEFGSFLQQCSYIINNLKL